jgi:hypothetical protein
MFVTVAREDIKTAHPGLIQHRKISAGGQVRQVVVPYRIESLPRSLEEPSLPEIPPDGIL